MFFRLNDLFPDHSPNGVFAAAERSMKVDSGRIALWCYDPPPSPREDTLRRVSEGLARRIAERNRECGIADPALTANQLRQQIMSEYGWERTYEEEIALNRPRCPMCGEVQKRGEVCSACNPLHRILEDPLRKDLGRYVFMLMALARGLSPDRIVPLVGAPAEKVKEWEIWLRRTDLVAATRSKMAKGLSLFRATAAALGIGANMLTYLLHGVYQPKGKRKRMARTFTRRPDLAARLGLEEDEYLQMAEVAREDPKTKNKRMRHARLERDRRRGILPSGPGRIVASCRFVQAVLAIRWKALSWQEIVNGLTRDEFPQVSQDGIGADAKTLRDSVIQHGGHCRRCRPLVAMDLEREEQRTLREIAGRLNVSVKTAHLDLAHMERVHPFAYRLTMGKVALLLIRRGSPSTIRRLVDRDLKCHRSPGGYRYFYLRDLQPLLSGSSEVPLRRVR